jgi:lipopolysaccharide export LptBFGC system permease protein LptF
LTLQLYILRQLVFGVAFSVGGMVFIAIPGLVVNAVHTLGSVGMSSVFGYLPLVMVDLLPYMLPIGFLLTVVATYGRLAADNEWTAMCMAGISPFKLALPGLLVALTLSGGTHYLVSYMSPGLRFQKRDYARQQVVEQFKNLPPGRTELQLGGFYMNARRRDPEQLNFYDVWIHVPPREDDGESVRQTILADELQLRFDDRYMVVELRSARRIFSAGAEDTDTFLGRIQMRRNLDDMFHTRARDRIGWKYQRSDILRHMLSRGEVGERDVDKASFELHRRYQTATSCLLFLLLGVPTGLILRRGTQLGAMTVAVAYVLLHHVLTMKVGKTLGLTEGVPVWLGAWGTSIAGLLVAIVMIRRALMR